MLDEMPSGRQSSFLGANVQNGLLDLVDACREWHPRIHPLESLNMGLGRKDTAVET